MNKMFRRMLWMCKLAKVQYTGSFEFVTAVLWVIICAQCVSVHKKQLYMGLLIYTTTQS